MLVEANVKNNTENIHRTIYYSSAFGTLAFDEAKDERTFYDGKKLDNRTCEREEVRARADESRFRSRLHGHDGEPRI